jgi:hemolysin activation/secretion protein
MTPSASPVGSYDQRYRRAHRRFYKSLRLKPLIQHLAMHSHFHVLASGVVFHRHRYRPEYSKGIIYWHILIYCWSFFGRPDRHSAGLLMSRSFILAISALAACAVPLPSTAQVDPAIQLRDEARQSQREADTQPPRNPAPSAAQPALNESPADVAEVAAWLHSPRITVRGNPPVDQLELDRTLAPYRSLSLGQKRLELLIRQLNALLVRRGLVTSHARVSRVDSGANTLEIELLTGTIGAMKEDGKSLDAGLRNAFPSNEGDPLVLRDLEQGVHQIQRLRMFQAEMRILPGQSPTSSDLDLTLKQNKPWWLQLSLDNQGAESTGTRRSRGTLTWENPLGLLDSVAATYVRSDRSEAVLAAMSVPQGYNTWSASYAASRYRQPLPAGVEETGGSNSGSVAWNRALYLAADGRDSADLALTYSDAERRIAGISLTPERLTVARGTLTRVRQGAGWQAWGEGGAVVGLPWFGAIDDSDRLQRADAHAQFTKVELHGGVSVTIADTGVQYAGQIDLQYSRVGLYGPEQFRLGGMTSVRGYQEGIVVGDYGYLFRHELQLPPQSVEAWNATLRPFAFIDHGSATPIAGSPLRLASAGAGMRANQKYGSVEIALAKPIDHSSTIVPDRWTLHFAIRIDL